MMKILTRDQILEAPDIRKEEVEVPEWNGTVFVKTLTAAERDQFEISIMGESPGDKPRIVENIRAKLIALSVVNENGERLFTMEDIEALSKKSSRAIDRLFAVAQRLSGFRAQDVEELTKKLKPDQGEDSPSG